MATPAPLLDLTTDRERNAIRIDGVPYELRDAEDLSLAQNKTLQRIGTRIEALEDIEEPSDLQAAEYSDLITRLCALVLIDASDEVIARLSEAQKKSVAATFIGLSAPSLLGTRATLEALKTSLSLGPKPSLVSSASTVVPRRRGARTRR